MKREEKAKIIDALAEELSASGCFYVTNAMGLSATEVNELRSKCFEKGVTYRVVKNTFIKRALEKIAGEEYKEFNEQVLKGFSGVMIVPSEGAKLPAQIIKNFRKENGLEKPLLKGASVEAAFYYGEGTLDALSKLKSKEELIGEVVLLLQSPAKRVISALQSGGQTLTGVIKRLSEREEGEAK